MRDTGPGIPADQYEAMKRWIAYVKEGNPDLLWKNRSGPNFGDWLNIGAAFPHKEGDGFNLVLQALPLHGNGKLVMRASEPDAQAEEEDAR